MARLVTSGFEWRTAASVGLTGAVEVDGVSGLHWSVDTTNFRSGAAAASLAVTSGSSDNREFAFTAPASGTGMFVRFYFRKSADIGTARIICSFPGQYGIRVNTDGTLSLVWGTTVIGSSSAVLSNATYYRVELSQTMNTAAGSDDSGAAYLEGVQFASETNVARGNFMANSFDIGTGDSVAAGGVTWLYDDLAINDSTGAAQNGLPGSGKVVLLRPVTPDNARGANWVGGAGGTTNLFDAQDNTPPVGVALASATNTSQIKNVTKDTTGNYDANMTTYTTAGIVANDTIKVVHPHWNIGSSGTTISHAMLLVSNPAANGGTESTSTPSAIAGTYASNWFWLWPAAQIVYSPSPTLGTSPVMRVGKRTSSTTAAMCDAMGIYVDYTPAVPASLPPSARTARNSLLRR